MSALSAFPRRALFRLLQSGMALFLLLTPAFLHAVGLGIAAQFPDRQPTGVAVSKQGRIFLCFPHWDDFRSLSVAELLPNGHLQPYPYEWDQDGVSTRAIGAPMGNAFFCVQSVFCDDQDTLWILDAAAPGMNTTVGDQVKLIAVDLTKDKSRRIYPINAQAAPAKSYLNDVRIDNLHHAAYLTDSGLGALLVLNLDTGDIRRVLDNAPATHAEPGFQLTVLGQPLLGPDGKPPQIHADGIELSPDGNTLYFHALCANALYRIDTASLRDPKLPPDQLAAKIEKVADTGPVDGLGRDASGTLYLTSLQDGALRRLAPTPGASVETVIQDPRLQWPDSLAFAPDGTIYLTCSQIENTPRFNQGKSVRTTPYTLFKIIP